MSELIDLDIAINLNKNYYRRQGRKQEQDSIIKLLEEQKAIQCKKAHCESYTDGHDYDCLSEEIDGYIALIKGETK